MGAAVETQTDAQIAGLFAPLFQTFENAFATENRSPLLAHYTSIRVMEDILRSSEVWFSNPLFMNDMQELVHGLNEGTKFFSDIGPLKKAGGSDERAEI